MSDEPLESGGPRRFEPSTDFPAPSAPPARPRRPKLPDYSLRARLRRRLRWLRGKPPIDWYDLGDDLQMGRHTFFKPRVRWDWGSTAQVRVGSFTGLSGDVEMLLGGGHNPNWVSTFAFRARMNLPGALDDGIAVEKGDIVIGSDVYVGLGSKILAGVTIGDGAIVGAFSVVTKDVRPYAVVVGHPAREIRRRYSDDVVERLLRIRWWDWPDEDVIAAVPLLSSDRIDEFLDRYDRSAAPAPSSA